VGLVAACFERGAGRLVLIAQTNLYIFKQPKLMSAIQYSDVAFQIQTQSNLLANHQVIESNKEFVLQHPLVVLEMIIWECCEAYGIDADLLPMRTRKREVVECRQAAMWLACKWTTLGLKRIGERFGGRDHSTVIHSREVMEELIWQKDKAGILAKYVDTEIYRKINNKPD
jgi:chromosomal replication initiation ATPase DnaA